MAVFAKYKEYFTLKLCTFRKEFLSLELKTDNALIYSSFLKVIFLFNFLFWHLFLDYTNYLTILFFFHSTPLKLCPGLFQAFLFLKLISKNCVSQFSWNAVEMWCYKMFYAICLVSVYITLTGNNHLKTVVSGW